MSISMGNVLVKVRDEDIRNGTFIIPKGITTIGEFAFSDCTNLTSIDIPEGVTIIKEHAFSKCSSLTEVNIPSSIKEIKSWVFYNCESLKSVTIQGSIIEIEDWAFDCCKALETINITGSFIKIKPYAFSNCIKSTLKIRTSLFYINMNDLNTILLSIKLLKIYNTMVIFNPVFSLTKIRKEELMDEIKSQLLDNGIKTPKCFKISEHKEFIDKIIGKLETIDDYDYRLDFNNYIKDYIDKHKEEIINIENVLKEIQNCQINYNELKKYPYIISTLLLNIKISYSKNEETIKLKKVLSKLTKIELNNPSDFVKLFLKLFFDSDEGVIINKVSIDKLISYSKKQIKILEEQNKTFETLKEIIRVYLDKEKECKTNLNVSEDDLKDLELSKEKEYLNYEQITNEIDYNFSCIMQLKK